MTKYEPITFNKLSEAIAYVEDGGELFMKRNSNHGYSESNICSVSRNDLCIYDFWKDSTLCAKAKPAPWREKLDGTVEGGVLCWVDDGGDCEDKNVDLVIGFDDSKTYDTYKALTCAWTCATPLTRIEIQKLMDNAPEEV